jgi:hypothetical protein
VTKKRRRIRKAPTIPKSRRNGVTRAEFHRLIDLLNKRGEIINKIRQQVEQNARSLEVQFARMAQMQADLDLIKRTLAKLTAIY